MSPGLALNWILALASSGLLVLLFPRFSFVWAAPFALTPLLIACAREDRWKWRFGLGYLTGFVYWFGLCSWIHNTLAQYAGVNMVVAWLLFVLFCLAKSLQLGVFAAVAGRLMRSPIAVPGIAALWVVLEYTHAWTGFEWLNLGNAGDDMTVLLRLAPFTGVWGLSFIFAMMSAAIACLILRVPRSRIAWLLLLPALYLLPDIPAEEHGNINSLLVQPNLSDSAEWTPELVNRTERQLSMLSLSPVLNGKLDASIIVWPEMPAPFYEDDPSFRGILSGIAQASHGAVLTGIVGRAADGQPLNSALLTGPDGKVISRYDKVHLVPFGEFVPWPFGLVTKKVSTEAGDFEPGKNIVVSNLGSHRIGTFICYESVFPGYIRQFAAAGAEALFNLSNDSWFEKSAARYQHFQIVRMRAVENRRWILRATDNGITASIDPAGRVLRAAKEYEELAARFPYRYRQDLTFYTRFGDWFPGVCVLIAALAFFL